MSGFIQVNLLLYLFLNNFTTFSAQEYWSQRANLLAAEENMALGGNLRFEDGEGSANELLMKLKKQEINAGTN